MLKTLKALFVINLFSFATVKVKRNSYNKKKMKWIKA